MVNRGIDGDLSICVYRKPTHTDRYLHFNSHHPSNVSRGVVKCLFDRADRLVTSHEDLMKEKEHITSVLVLNGYPHHFINTSINKKRKISTEDRNDAIRVIIPYVRGLSEGIRRVCRHFNIITGFRTGLTLRNQLTKVKGILPTVKQSGVVYKIPCSCGKFYIGETKRRLETRMKEHIDACKKCSMEKSAIAEHAWTTNHQINWTDASILDKSSNQFDLRVKEALHIQMSGSNQIFNRDVGLEIPGCWASTLKSLKFGHTHYLDARRN
jgi:predicted GIY-YIG superfamily endonuclease